MQHFTSSVCSGHLQVVGNVQNNANIIDTDSMYILILRCIFACSRNKRKNRYLLNKKAMALAAIFSQFCVLYAAPSFNLKPQPSYVSLFIRSIFWFHSFLNYLLFYYQLYFAFKVANIPRNWYNGKPQRKANTKNPHHHPYCFISFLIWQRYFQISISS